MQHLFSVTVLKGLLIGSTMIIPGVSGGSMAMILGIYDRLIASVSSFFKKPGKNIVFLSIFSTSAILGMILFSTPLSLLLTHFRAETLYFFIGAVFGSIPMIEKKSHIRSFSPGAALYLILGVVPVLSFQFLPECFFTVETTNAPLSWLFLMVAGIVCAAALILPGISLSHFLLILGLYEGLLDSLKTFNLSFLVPLGLGLAFGIILLTRALEFLMEHYPKQSYLTILGFLLGSAAQIFPGIPRGISLIICPLLALSGFFAASWLAKKES